VEKTIGLEYLCWDRYQARTSWCTVLLLKQRMMATKIKFKELLDTARLQLNELTAVPNPDFRLEQAEADEEAGEWNIVVSFLVENTEKRSLPIHALVEPQYQRVYKKVKVNAEREIVGIYMFSA
jgi:hypothetical protein